MEYDENFYIQIGDEEISNYFTEVESEIPENTQENLYSTSETVPAAIGPNADTGTYKKIVMKVKKILYIRLVKNVCVRRVLVSSPWSSLCTYFYI